jgi:hypothetical protein
MKDYRQEIRVFHDKLLSNERFALRKFADGEWGAIKGVQFAPANGEWEANRNEPSFEIARQELSKALQYKHPQYYTAICPCYTETIAFSGQPESNITYANILVRSSFGYWNRINIYNNNIRILTSII